MKTEKRALVKTPIPCMEFIFNEDQAQDPRALATSIKDCLGPEYGPMYISSKFDEELFERCDRFKYESFEALMNSILVKEGYKFVLEVNGDILVLRLFPPNIEYSYKWVAY
jgi:hypothetical protein